MTFEKWWKKHCHDFYDESSSVEVAAKKAWKASIRRARKICHRVAGDCAPSAEEGGYDSGAHHLAEEILAETEK